ncbi:MAG TPA: hypothetical protein VFF79_03120 [Conexibacter sp.]|jgi:hypothetical protein|nr:hypothetical protein [Conexibacter sp.]
MLNARLGRTVPVTAVAALMLAAATPVAHAVSPVVKLTGRASLTRFSTAGGSVSTAAKFHVATIFSTDTPGTPLFTIQKAVTFFPDHSGSNGRLFKSCSAAQIERFHGNIGRCPKGSIIGSGTVEASALQLGITATGRVTMFNSHRGKSITFNIQTTLPAYINESLDAPLTQLHGTYGEKLTLVVPHSLQEIISGVFVGVQKFDVTIGGAVLVHGVEFSFLKARTCPKLAMRGVFDFENWATGQTATATTDAKVHCTNG